MLGKRPALTAVLCGAVAVGASVMFLLSGSNRHDGPRAHVSACALSQTDDDPLPATTKTGPPRTVALKLDYAGAEALINALERPSLSDADVDSLLLIPGLCAMVDNVTRFIPGTGVSEFRKEIRGFAGKKKGGKHDRYFQFSGVWKARSQIRNLIAAIRADERKILEQTALLLERYPLDSGPRPTINVYFVAGGVSDGFIFDNDPASLYANLARADGDLNGVILNMAHEAFHALQFAAQQRAGITVLPDSLPVVERLFMTTLTEGTANYVIDPNRFTGTGRSVEAARERYRRHAEPARITKNFALFDDVLISLADGRMEWEKAYRQGFTSDNDASFYFVGYEMTKAIATYCGDACVADLFKEPPVEFFRQYIALYRKHPEIKGLFSRETESIIEAYPKPKTRRL